MDWRHRRYNELGRYSLDIPNSFNPTGNHMKTDYKTQIENLATTTHLTNAQIARKLGCSKRSVRRYAGAYAARLKNLFGIEEDALHTAGAKILLFDIETSPMEVLVWQLKQQGYISPESIIKDWSILTWSAKWLFEDQMFSARVSEKEANNRRDESVISELWDLLDEADIVVAHNAKGFDVRKTNTRFVLNGLNPPLPYSVIDTLQVCRQKFKLSSNKLDYVCGVLGLPQKGHPGYNTWKLAIKGGDPANEALEVMREYCDNDVGILEELYVKIRPWIKGHPNIGLYVDTDGESCTNCGSVNLDWAGKYYTPAGRYLAFRCRDCFTPGRSRTTDIDAEERKRICIGVA
jgi:hypothetical protein